MTSFTSIDYNANISIIGNLLKPLSIQEQKDFIDSMITNYQDREDVYTVTYIDKNGNKFPTTIYGSRSCAIYGLKKRLKEIIFEW